MKMSTCGIKALFPVLTSELSEGKLRMQNYPFQDTGKIWRDEQRAKSKLTEYDGYAKKLESLSEYHNNYSKLHDKYIIQNKVSILCRSVNIIRVIKVDHDSL